jgi:hypothetical protein
VFEYENRKPFVQSDRTNALHRLRFLSNFRLFDVTALLIILVGIAKGQIGDLRGSSWTLL